MSRRTDPPPPSAAAPPDEPDEAELDAALDALDALDASPPAPIDRTSIDSLIIEARDPDDSEGPVEPPPVLDPLPWLDAPVGPLRIAVAGGKGGVGRSLLTANLGLMMARLGRSVLLADLDPNGPALHTYLGLDALVLTPGELLRPPGPPRFEAVAGSAARLCRPASPVVTPAQREAVRAATRDEAVDVLLLDLGAQADPLTLDAFLEADVSVVITVPQPAAIERMYCFLRAALHRRLFGGDDEAAVVARALLTADRVGQLDSPARLIDALGSVHPDAAEALRARVLGFAPKVLVNRCRNRGDSELGADLVFALRRRLGVSAEWIGSIEGDEAAAESARRRRPLALTWPGASLSAAIDRLARRLLGQLEGREVRA